jgi:hypothetical protein
MLEWSLKVEDSRSATLDLDFECEIVGLFGETNNAALEAKMLSEDDGRVCVAVETIRHLGTTITSR